MGVVDTGITPHPDLNSKVVAGYDFISNTGISRDGNGRDSNPNDEGDWIETDDSMCATPDRRFVPSSWHGTHVAGTVAAATDNATGVAGVAASARILPVRVLGHCGGYSSDIIDGMLWAAGLTVNGAPANANPAEVLNLSLGGSGSCDAAYQDAISRINGRGSVIVVAAGNETRNASNSTPANCPGVITVGSTNRSGGQSYFSNYGTALDVSAPGGDLRSGSANGILSTVNTGTRQQSPAGYGIVQGTSMAAPHVAGVAALMGSLKPSLVYGEYEQILRSTARPLPGSCSGGCGAGIVDALAAVRAVGGGGGDGGTTPPPTTTTDLVTNGGFESGTASWTGNTAAINQSQYPAASGTWKAWLLGYGQTRTEQISQQVSVPSDVNKVAVSYKLRVDSAETGTTAYDTLKVQLLSTSGTVLATLRTHSNVDKSGSYATVTVNVSGVAGRTMVLRFLGQEDSMLKTSFLVDDVSMVPTA